MIMKTIVLCEEELRRKNNVQKNEYVQKKRICSKKRIAKIIVSPMCTDWRYSVTCKRVGEELSAFKRVP